MFANVNRDQKKQPKPFTPGDFFPSLDTTGGKPDQISLAAKLMAALGFPGEAARIQKERNDHGGDR